MLMRLTPTDRLKPVTSCSIAVVSCGEDDTFGDRLGTHMINALLPGEAEVHHLNFRTLNEAREQYDLVVLGTGNSLFQPLLSGDVLDIIGRGKASIGIFGTQYRELIPRPAIERVIERLDTWYARSEDDVLMYGRGRKNVVHLGDWLIDQFPLSRPTENEPLQIGPETGVELPLDRIIKIIQSHRQVYSARLAPLLCALTSADYAAYEEAASAQKPDIVSGQFRSMLIDIFGRSYPDKEVFMVDRDAVTALQGARAPQCCQGRRADRQPAAQRRGGGRLVIPGRRAAANPESRAKSHSSLSPWIPGSRSDAAPRNDDRIYFPRVPAYNPAVINL